MAKTPRKRLPSLEQWGDLKLFLEVARSGSFSAASRAMGIEQSTVSRRMAAFEEELDAAVFDRKPNGTSLTELGEKVMLHAEAVEAELNALLDEASGHERDVEGTVRLALTESIAVHAVIPQVLPLLYEAHPKLSVTLDTSYEVADLGNRQAELALRFFRPHRGDLVAQRIAQMPTALVAHRRFRQTPLAELPFIAVELAHTVPAEAHYLKRHVRQAPRLVTSSYVAQIQAVRSGLGVALLAKNVCQLDKQLAVLDLGLPPAPVLELWLVAPRSLRHVPRIAAVWAALEAGLAFLSR